jgi:hypothetical protein
MGGPCLPIQRVEIRNRRLSPAEAEVWVSVIPGRPSATAEVRGRLVGPRCLYASTVEVAYPLRPLGRQPQDALALTVRAVIPEPSLWDPQSPFLYQGTAEFWQHDVCRGTESFRWGLRELQLTSRGFLCNGRRWPLRGVSWRAPPPAVQKEDAEQQRDRLQRCLGELRQEGINLLVVPAEEGSDRLWSAADEFGFLVFYEPGDAEYSLRLASSLARHPCALGWLVSPVDDAAAIGKDLPPEGFLGVDIQQPVRGALPPGIRFVLCPEEYKDHPSLAGVPKLIRADTAESGEGAEILGHVRR